MRVSGQGAGEMLRTLTAPLTLKALGDPARTEVDEKEVRVFDQEGAPLLTIMRAPVKSRARMLNKLQSAKVRVRVRVRVRWPLA